MKRLYSYSLGRLGGDFLSPSSFGEGLGMGLKIPVNLIHNCLGELQVTFKRPASHVGTQQDIIGFH